ncbi:hypothetical protein [Maribacter sp. 2304DJ31-5]|uniref:hypothetical protein n=1 Tax=Maribacter sp. 2304DJ31-5 TaxID=3386273 RepID=UPI0039BC376A
MSQLSKNIFDYYFSRPVVWDLTIVLAFMSLYFFLLRECLLILPDSDSINTLTLEVSNIAFTSAGFVLTFLTLLITFKVGANVSKEDIKKNQKEKDADKKKINIFDIFLASDYYNETIRHLKNAIKVLIAIALIGYLLKLVFISLIDEVHHFFNIAGVVLISATLLRCLVVLTKILKFHEQEEISESS